MKSSYISIDTSSGYIAMSFSGGKARHPNKKEQRKLNLDTVKLYPGEELCTDCRGTGTLVYCTKKRFNKDFWVPCNKCNGMGKFDWIDVIFNKHREEQYV